MGAAALLEYPNLHVFHYASYEKTALGNLAARHQIYQPLWDQWLREELFVDLYPIVRRGLLIGSPSIRSKRWSVSTQTPQRGGGERL